MQSAQAAPSRASRPAGKGECGLPTKRPLWIDFGDGSVPFWQMFAKPGLVSAAANFVYPPRIRALGGNTVYFDLNFHKRLGSPSKPIAEASVLDSANKLFYYASASSGCAKPWIALNELFGAGLPTPWLETIKWQALAARQVASELRFPTIWSWGWGEWGGGSVDPDKPAAACVYLWTRNPSLCDGPKAAGPGFNTSRTDGQINLPSGVQCIVGGTRMADGSISR